MGSRAICVSRDPEVRRVVGEARATAGIAVEHHDVMPDSNAVATRGADGGGADELAVVVVDRAARKAAGERLGAVDAPVVVVGDSLDDDGLITLMLEAPVSHLVADPHDPDLEITSEKLATGDLFGLEKYVARGAQVAERTIASELDKRSAVGELCAWAESVGARAPIVHRLASVVDELLMNAMIDAPRGSAPSIGAIGAIGATTGTSGPVTGSALLRWSSDDRVLAISVGDRFGSLRQRDVIDHVRRARGSRGRPRAATAGAPGAGLGLYLVLANVASLIVNVDPGRRTEVVCLFDLSRGARRAVTGGARSLHVFSGNVAV